MALHIGDRIGPYRVVGGLGAGGMGEVYRATDARLNRDVALKVLPAAITHDPVRAARFTREAQILASLNHPNIGGIYGLEEANGFTALVLELVEGPTLADRLADGGIRVADAIPIARQIAEALGAAHEQGIVHRDLKPANIKVRPDGTVKVLDFGLAKATDPSLASAELAQAATQTMGMTHTGVIMGTAAYMSPEQASGKPVDRRTDIWAFGAVLYEMLTGERPFHGETASHVLAAVLRDEPDLDALPPDTPPAVRLLIERCLEKDPKRRLDSAAALRIELEATHVSSKPRSTTRLAPPARWGARPVVWMLASAAVAATLTWSVAARLGGSRVPQGDEPVVRFAITPPPDLPLMLSRQAAARDFAVAPDGTYMVYRAGAKRQLVVRWFDRLDAVTLDGIESALMPFISPDSRWIGFVQDDLLLRKVAATGGAAVTLARLPVWPRGGTWVNESTIVIGTNSDESGLLRVPAGGGEPTVLTKPDRAKGEEGHILPSALPDGQSVLFTIGAADPARAQIAVFDLKTGRTTPVLSGGRDAQYVASGHLVFMSGVGMSAVPFDAETRLASGAPVRVLDGLAVAPTGALNVAMSRAGTLVMVQGQPLPVIPRTLSWVERDGRETPIAAPPRPYESVRISPDGTRLALGVRDQDNDIWLWSLAQQSLTRATFDPDVDVAPAWLPDSRHFVFASARTGAFNLWMHEADGPQVDVRVTSSPNTQVPDSVLPDGQTVILREVRPNTRADVVQVQMPASATQAAPRTTDLVQTPVDEWNAVLSPDNRLLAYQSTDSQTEDIFVRPYPQTGGRRWQVSQNGATAPAWSRDGRELFYLDASQHLVAVPVDRVGDEVRFGLPRTLNGVTVAAPAVWRSYDIAPDGRRFVVIKDPAAPNEAVSTGFVVVQHWLAELARLAPSP